MLKDKIIFITGASRGIGLAIALRAARDGAKIAIAAKTSAPHPKLSGTIFTAAEAVEAAGGRALPLVVDVRDEDAVAEAVERTVEHFGGLDICVNNASAIDLQRSESIAMKRYDLLQQVNTRGTFLVSRTCIPHLMRSANPHILTLSPPLAMRAEWFAAHIPYTISKYGMSMVMLGMTEEFRSAGVACNCLWPRTTIATAAVEFVLGGGELLGRSRQPEIMADAAHAILLKEARAFTGRFLIDEEVLRDEGVSDFKRYAPAGGGVLAPDLFVDPEGFKIETAAAGGDGVGA